MTLCLIFCEWNKNTSTHMQEHVLYKFTVHMCVLSAYLYIRKGHAYDEVAGPVAASSNSNGRRSRSLAEQLSNYEPWNGTRTNLKETHEEEDSWHADVAHPRVFTLRRRVHQSILVCASEALINIFNSLQNWTFQQFLSHLFHYKDEMVTDFLYTFASIHDIIFSVSSASLSLRIEGVISCTECKVSKDFHAHILFS